MENLGYGLGAMANLGKTGNMLLNTEKKDIINHSAILDEKGNRIISQGSDKNWIESKGTIDHYLNRFLGGNGVTNEYPIYGENRIIKKTHSTHKGNFLERANIYSLKTIGYYYHNGMRILAGKYYTDNNKDFFSQLWQGISRNTWEAPQTWLGYNYSQVRNSIKKVDRVDYFAGATFVTDEEAGHQLGVSLGNFINVDIRGQINGAFRDHLLNTPLYMHEYGHYIDSQTFGLSYLFAIGLPSLISATISEQIENEPDGVTEHKFRWYEMRANRNAARYFGKHYGVDWTQNEIRYPRRRR